MAAATAKSLQLCLTLCNPMDRSLPGSSVHGIFQTRVLEWGAIVTGTWNVRSMNKGKLNVIQEEMARLNVNILGINELKWTRMDKFNSDDHDIYYCGQEFFRRNGVALIVL